MSQAPQETQTTKSESINYSMVSVFNQPLARINHSALDGAQLDAFDYVLLQEDEDDNHGDYGHCNRGHQQVGCLSPGGIEVQHAYGQRVFVDTPEQPWY